MSEEEEKKVELNLRDKLISEIKQRQAYRRVKRETNKTEGLIGHGHTREKRRPSAIDDIDTLLEIIANTHC